MGRGFGAGWIRRLKKGGRQHDKYCGFRSDGHPHLKGSGVLGFGCMMNDILCFKWLSFLVAPFVCGVPDLTAQQATELLELLCISDQRDRQPVFM